MVGVRRSTLCTVASSSPERREERPGLGLVCRRSPGEHARHDRKTLARRAERLDDVAEIGRMLVAKETEEAPVGKTREQHLRALGLRDRMLRLERLSVLAAGLEVFAVEREMLGARARARNSSAISRS